MRRFFILFALILCLVTLSVAITPADNGKWIATGSLLAARQGAAAVALPDGRVLVTGGRASDGSVLSSTEIIRADGTAIAGAAMVAPRAGHTATLLPTGSVLIVGGESGTGATVTAELYDANANLFVPLTSSLSDARTGHVAALDANGNVTIIGGMTASGPVMSVESFNASTQQFASIGRMMYSRSRAAIAPFKDGRVLIAGGVDADGVTLDSTEIFDPITGVSVAGPTMNVARAGATATLQIDGNIIVIGGTTPNAQGNAIEVASGELFAADGTSSLLATVLNVARAGHTAFLMPENAGVLVVGGQAAGADLNTAELYQPWTGKATLSTMAVTHAGGAGVAKPGVIAVASGTNQLGIELFGFPTIKTDYPDYAPGTAVWMTGTGWLPQETVSLYMQAIPSTANVAPTITTTADAAGNISDGTWAPDITDIGARFYLTAVGTTSGWQAQNTFTDASPTLTMTITGSGKIVATRSSGNATIASCNGIGCTFSNSGTPNATCTSGTCTVTWSGNYSANLVATANTNYTFSGWSGAGNCTGTGNCAASAGGNGSFAATATFTLIPSPTLTSISPSSATYGDPATTITVTGTNFSDGVSSINFNGNELLTSCSSATTCTGIIAVNLLKTPVGGLPVYVHNLLNNSSSRTFTLNPKPITVTATTNTKIYDGTTTAAAIPTTVGLVTGDTSNFTEAYSTKDVGSGNKTLIPSGTVSDGNGGSNYSYTFVNSTNGTISAKALTYSGLSVPASKVYDGTTNAVVSGTAALQASEAAGAGSTSDGKPYSVDSIVLSGSPTGTFNSKDVATATSVTFGGLSLTGTGNGNYTLTAATQAASITAKSVGYYGVSLPLNKVYDGTTNAVVSGTATLNASEAPGTGSTGDRRPYSVDSVTLSGTATGVYDSKDVATATMISVAGLSLTGSGSSNYTLGATAQPAYITPKALTISGLSVPSSKVYDGTVGAAVSGTAALQAAEGAGTGSTSDGKPYNVDSVSLVGSPWGEYNSKDVASATTVTFQSLLLTGAGRTNYTLTTLTQAATITPKALTVTGVSASNKTYDGTTASAINTSGATLVGVVSGDTVNLVTTGAVGTFSDKNVGTGKPVQVAGLALSGSSSGNYTVTQPTATANITPLPITASIAAQDKNYEGSVSAVITNCGLSGVLSGDSANVSCSIGWATFASASAGLNKVVTAEGISLTGSAAGNYNLSSTTATTTANINPLSVTPSVTANNKTYDGTTTTSLSNCYLSGLLPADAANVHCSAAAVNFDDPYAGSNKPVTASGISLTGSAAGNYQLSSTTANTTAAIGQLQVTPSITAADKQYDTTTTATITGCQLSGVMPSDIGSLSCSTADPHFNTQYVGRRAAIADISLTGAAVRNYALTTPRTSVDANITPAPVIASITAQDKNYDGTANANVNCTLSGVFLADEGQVDCSSTDAAFNNANVGNNKPVTANIALSGNQSYNYALTSNTAASTATIRTLTVNAHITAQDKNYDGTATATVTGCFLNDVINGDNVGCQASSAYFDSANAGNGKVVTASSVTLIGASAGNYVLGASVAQGNANISPASVMATAGSYTGVYDGFAHAPTGCVLSGAYTSGLSCVNNPVSVGPGVAAGAVTAVVSGPTSNFTITPVDGSYSISQAPANIVITNLTHTYDGSPKAPSVGAMTSNLLVTYTGIAPTDYPTSATPPANPGNYTVTATSADPNYFGTQSATLVINAAATSLNLAILTGGSNPSPYGSMVVYELRMPESPCPTGQIQFYLDGSAFGGPVTLQASDCGKPVRFESATLPLGQHSLYADYAGDAIYQAQRSNTVQHTVEANGTSVTLASTSSNLNVGQSVTFTATVSPTSTLDGAVQPPSGDVQFLDDGAEIGRGTLSTTAPYTATFATTSLSAGRHTISAKYTSPDSLYTGSSSDVTIETVDRFVPVITWTPSTTSLTYGDKITSEMLNATAALDGKAVVGHFSYDVSVGDVLAAAQRNITATFIPDDGATYASPTKSVTFTISQAILTVTADDQSRTYGAANPTFTYQLAGFVNGEDGSVVTGTPGLTTTADATSPVGKYTIAVGLSGLSATNYTFAAVNGNLSVTPATLTVTADAKSKNVGEANPSLTVTYNGFLNGDTTAVLSGAPGVTTTATTNSPRGSYPITVDQGTLSATNYNFTFVPGTLTVNNAALTLTWPTPAPITTTVALSSTQLNATASVPGIFTYNPPAGTLLSAGSQTLSVTFTPTDLVNYGVTTASVTIQIYQSKGAAAVPVMSPNGGTFYNQTTQVTITSSPGAPIYYTTDGSLPTPNSNLYTGPITVTGSMTIRAYAIGNGYTASPNIAGNFKVVASVPVLSPTSSTFNDKTHTVTITDASGAPIYYTTDNSTPTAKSIPYTGPITISSTMVIRAIAVGNGFAASSTPVGTYTLVAATPVFSMKGGTYTGAQTLTITSPCGAPVYYTTDGTTPTVKSTLYTGPINITSSMTIRAFATGNGFNSSSVLVAAYTIR